MDWTIVVSVLVALLLWPLVVVSLAALIMLPIVAVLRGRSQRIMAGMMSACMNQYQGMMADFQTEKGQPLPSSDLSSSGQGDWSMCAGEEVGGGARPVSHASGIGTEARQHARR